jgi:hypothetical protein
VRLRLAFDFSVYGSDIEQYGGLPMTDNWGAEAANKLRKKQDAKELENSVVLEKSRLRKEQGPALWEEVRRHVKTKCEELNANYGTKIAEVDLKHTAKIIVVLAVNPADRKTITASFEPTSAKNALHWEYENCLSPGYAYALEVNGDKVFFATGSLLLGDGATAPEAIATKMLDGLLLE